ncbi:MAG TPA: ubiquinol-cytochrome c reductase iron-sulfur subunit [Caulobacteraceae bacterium]
MAESVAGASADHSPDPSRRDFIYIATAAAAVGGVAAVVWPLVDQMNPSADTLALASIEYDVTKVALGQQVTLLWRKQPLFVRHRTPKEIAEAENPIDATSGQPIPISALRDPQADSDRVKAGKSEWLIVVGVCTHLGCTPNFGEGPYGGYLCHCHGSIYDTSGRIRAGPAPKNLAVPDYSFLTDSQIKVG